jgi:hypothetical protein
VSERRDPAGDEAVRERVERYLARLPGALPDAELGSRVVDRHLRRRRRRRLAAPLVAAAALALFFLLPALRVPSTPVGPVGANPDPVLLEIRSADRRLQAAYVAGAGPAELDALWRVRAAAARPDAPIRL